MEWLFGKKKSPQEVLRENKRLLDRSIRDIDRERMGLQTQEKKLVIEIKKMAKQGQMDAVKVMAKSMIRNRKAVTKMHQLKSHLQGISLRIQTLKSTQSMAQAMRGATKAMSVMSSQLSVPALNNIMKDFEKQNEKMEMAEEMMGDALDDAFEEDGEEEETDELVSSVLDEIGLDLDNLLVSAPQGAGVGANRNVASKAAGNKRLANPMGMGGDAENDEPLSGLPELPPDDDLRDRLNNLRKP
jgi:charged multivesicular body protein 2A